MTKTIVCKTEEELAKALIEHRELAFRDSRLLIDRDGRFMVIDHLNVCFKADFKYWITKELTINTKWYDNIPKEKVLCWCSNTNSKPDRTSVPDLIDAYDKNAEFPFIGHADSWRYAIPVTKDGVWEG